ncbi:hypothetical protein A3I25_00010 [Candidatus Nomurabacteria bacterium RIFCSPLOWO2_02_FULL_42_17]|uniref:Uncharacterized protein n=1 Tax=Candidatus Nomurabacteria bacterium RIFCSPLOWO2_02_FULL_42_17 TaxID=1801789 RepID=A0A1F6XQQ4_9BACT|nr:MAG: hypothetical protein A3I25_00010 [Candidatus Nomurabacteria bacterium RIFCSPLOWO2_02_FULL_42_17]
MFNLSKVFSKIIYLLTMIAVGLPSVALAAPNNIKDLLDMFTDLLINSVVPLLIAAAMVVFIWGMIEFVGNADNEEKRAKGKQLMLWGIIGFFVIVSIWGLVGLFTNFFGVPSGMPRLPE